MTMISTIAAISVGLSLGLLGGGGSILTVPILVYLLDYDPKIAIPMSLLTVGVGAFVGGAKYYFKGNIQVSALVSFLPSAMLGAWLGARLSTTISPLFQMVLFGTLTVLAALAMLRKQKDVKNETSRLPIVIASAFFVGILTGVVGVGGGFMIVPVLVYFANMKMINAVGTSLLIIAFNSFAALIGYIGVVSIPWGFSLAFTTAVVVGIFIGVKLSEHVDEKKLRRLFAFMLLAVGIYILIKNLS